MIKDFSNAVCERIGYYVYILKDPRIDSIFYVGKGRGNRVFQHVRCALENETENDKYNLIREIHNEGKEVEHFILRHGLEEKLSLEIESTIIDLLGIENLTNSVKGHDTWERGLKTVDEVFQHYDAKAVTFDEPCIIININRLYTRGISAQKLYDSTRASWIVGAKRDRANYAIASYRGLVREVYEIEKWQPNGDRWEFIGKVADDKIRDKYLNQSLENYIKKGGQNPIRYTFK
ncbi:MAG: hypothetical protein WCI71_18985 [Bacteroidota bacterium]